MQVGQTITRVADLRTCLLRIHTSIRQDLGFDRVGLFLYEAETQLMRGTFGTSRTGELAEEWHLTIPIMNRRSWQLVLSQPEGFLFTRDFEAEYDEPDMTGVKQHALVIARAGDKPYAAITVDNLLTQRPVTAEQLEALRLLAGYAGLAIENARLFEATHRQLEELTILHSAAVATAAAVDEATLLERIFEIIDASFWSDLFGILIWDETAGGFRARVGRGAPPELDATIFKPDRGIVGKVARQGTPYYAPDVRLEPAYVAGRPDILSELCVPIKLGERVIGLINVESIKLDNFSPADERLLATLAGQLAIGIERLRIRAERERLIAELKAKNTALLQSNRELQDFAYVASHDLQEPLRKIQAFSDRLKTKYSHQLDAQAQDYLSRMQNAAGWMQTLIHDVLAFSRVNTKAQPFILVELDIILEQVLADLETRLEETGGEVERSALPRLEADPTQMRQLFQNLLSNALKFHHPGRPPRIQITAEEEPGGALCRINITDNGIGFDEKYRERIFGVFQRLHGRGHYEGSGVGLAICRKIIERHGGSISATSVPGLGSTFVVTLPLRQ